MGTRKTMWTAAAAIAIGSVGCDNANSTSASPAPAATTSAVTNTNAMVPNTTDAGPAAADPMATVANRSKVKMDPDATKIDPPKPATLVTGFATMIRESPRGDMIESVETTTNVQEIARAKDYYLVTFQDPNGSNQKYAGWVYKDALENNDWTTADAGKPSDSTGKNAAAPPSGGMLSNTATSGAPPKISCTHGEAHLRTDRDFCAATCKDDKDCDGKNGKICDGIAFRIDPTKTSNARYCIADTSPNANSGHGPEHGSYTK